MTHVTGQSFLIPAEYVVRGILISSDIMRSDTGIIVIFSRFPGLQIESVRILLPTFKLSLSALDAKDNDGVM